MLAERARGHEVLDTPDADPADAAREYRFMPRINRWLGGTAVVRRFIRRHWRRRGRSGALHVLDIGAGGGDIAKALLAWARRRGLDLRMTCLENNPTGADLARQRLGRDDRASIVQEDVFAHCPERPYDLAVGSLFFHHLPDGRVVELVERLRGFVRHAVLINDLWRSGVHYAGGWVLTLGLPPTARHDALLSIRRGFRQAELRALLERLPRVRVRTGHAWLFRVWAEVEFAGAAAEGDDA